MSVRRNSIDPDELVTARTRESPSSAPSLVPGVGACDLEPQDSPNAGNPTCGDYDAVSPVPTLWGTDVVHQRFTIEEPDVVAKHRA